jgi:hypothetical protein
MTCRFARNENFKNKNSFSRTRRKFFHCRQKFQLLKVPKYSFFFKALKKVFDDEINKILPEQLFLSEGMVASFSLCKKAKLAEAAKTRCGRMEQNRQKRKMLQNNPT